MFSRNPKKSLYPEVDESNPKAISSSSSTPSLYPSIDVKEMAQNLFPDQEQPDPDLRSHPQASFESSEEVLIRIPGCLLHLIDKQQSVELAAGDFTIIRLRQGDNIVAVMARVGEEAIQWPLAKDEATVKLDQFHYFFSLHVPAKNGSSDEDDEESVPISGTENLLNYGLTIQSKGKKGLLLLKELDKVLEEYSAFSVQKVSGPVEEWAVAKEAEGKMSKEAAEGSSAAYWTTVAPNVEDYSSSVARMIAGGSGQLIRGILWCGDVTAGRLRWGNEFLKIRMSPGANSKISPEVMRRMKRVKKLTKRSEKVATGILSGVVKVSGFFTSSIVNSTPGKKFFSLLPGEMILASLDGFCKVCDAVEVAGKNVMSTTSVVTTGLVSHRYGEEAAEATNHGLDAAGYAIGTAWAVFKIRRALNPKSAVKPTTLAKAASGAISLKSKADSKLKASSKKK